MEIKFTMAVLKAIKNQIYSVFNPNAHFEIITSICLQHHNIRTMEKRIHTIPIFPIYLYIQYKTSFLFQGVVVVVIIWLLDLQLHMYYQFQLPLKL